MDKKLVFCSEQSCTSSFNSSAVNFGQAHPTTGANDVPLYLCVAFPTALAGTASLGVKLQESADNSNWSDVVDYGTVTKGFFAHTPLIHKQYLRVVGTVSGTSGQSITAGKMTAYLDTKVVMPMDTAIQGIAITQTID